MRLWGQVKLMAVAEVADGEVINVAVFRASGRGGVRAEVLIVCLLPAPPEVLAVAHSD